MTDYQHILYDEQGAIAIATINRPDKRNALALQTYAELGDVVQRVSESDSLRALVLTGAGSAFSAGADIDEVLAMENTADAAVARFRRSHGFILALAGLRKPVLAAVNGDAAGAGCSVALACDLRLMADSGRIGLTFARVGLGPDMGASYFLPRLVGLAKAYELAYTGDLVSAAEAERIGLVNRVVPAADVVSATVELATKIARGPMLALAVAKLSLTAGVTRDLAAVLDGEIASQSLLLGSRDGREGLNAFREKRRPSFG